MSNVKDFVIENEVLLKYTGTDKVVSIPEGVVTIGTSAFSRKSVVNVSMPDTVTEIGWDAFSSCRDLEKVTFSKNLKVISPNAFFNCQSLTEVVLYEGLEKIESCAFSGCGKLRELILPEHSIDIDNRAFDGCYSLADEEGFAIVRGVLVAYTGKDKKMHIPEGVKYIISNYNMRLDDVRSLKLPSSIEDVENKVFINMHKLEECSIGFSVDDPNEAKRLINKVFSWKALAFAYLRGELEACDLVVETLKKQIDSKNGRKELMGSLTWNENTVPLTRFLECVKKLPLEELDVAIEGTPHVSIRALLLEYKNKKYTVKNVEKAYQRAEDKELGIKEKTLSEWRKELKISKKGDYYVISGFKDDTARKLFIQNNECSAVITIPCQIGGIPVYMGERVFQDNNYIKTVIIEGGVTKIGDFCFCGCYGLRDVYVPASVTDFGTYGWAFCIERNQKPFTVHTPIGSKAEEMAKKENLSCVAE